MHSKWGQGGRKGPGLLEVEAAWVTPLRTAVTFNFNHGRHFPWCVLALCPGRGEMKVTALLEHLLQQGRCVSVQGAWALSNTINTSHLPTLQLPFPGTRLLGAKHHGPLAEMLMPANRFFPALWAKTFLCNVTLQRLHYVEIPYFINGMSSEGAVDWTPTSLGSLPGLLLCDGCRTGDSEGLSALERGGLQRPWDRQVPMGRALVSSMDFTPPRTIQREAMREALNWTGQRPMQLSSESAWKKASEVSYVDTEQTYGHRAGKRVGGWEAGADMYTLLLLLLSRSVAPDSFATPLGSFTVGANISGIRLKIFVLLLALEILGISLVYLLWIS